MKKYIFDVIQVGDKSNRVSRLFDKVLVSCIICNILSVFLITFDKLEICYPLLEVVEIVTTIFFSIEYMLRLWTADLLYPESAPLRARIRFIISFNGIVDLLTILPALFLSGFVVLRMLRVVRIFKLFRVTSTRDSFNIITSVLYNSRNQLVSSVFIILLMMLASSLCMYSVEHDAQPDIFENAFSGIWWSVSTILTVGYGDIYPVTTLGKLLAIVIAILGVGIVAVPTGIISAGFMSQYQKESVSIDDKVKVVDDIMFVNKTVRSIELDYGYDVLLIRREGVSIIPTKETVIKEGDKLLLE